MEAERSTSGSPPGPQPNCSSWAGNRLGLMKGLSMTAVAWAALSQSTAALIDLVAIMVRACLLCACSFLPWLRVLADVLVWRQRVQILAVADS